jgi:phosphoserine phosphatase
VALVLTLIAGPGAIGGLSSFADPLASLAAETPDWLAPEEACDLVFSKGDHGEIERAARERIGDAPVDVLVQPAKGRR